MFDHEIDPEMIAQRSKLCQESLDRVQDDLAAADIDVVIVIGDDQREMFDPSNSPALSVYIGDQIQMMRAPNSGSTHQGSFWPSVWKGYGMDPPQEFPAARAEALQLSRSLVASGFDLAVSETPSGHGFGHAIGFPIMRLRRSCRWRIIPVLINTYYPPNQPTPERCYELGRAIRAAIAAIPGDLRVAVIASGGLSHFVINEQLDMEVLAALHSQDRNRLTRIATELLDSGSSEIRNWIALGGAMADDCPSWSEYVPCYRSTAGTGCGMGFISWTNTTDRSPVLRARQKSAERN
jgi:3-O-methylgallate 3,4-dioxygenase